MTAPLDLAEVKARCEEAICADCGGAGQFGLRQHACDSCGGHEDAAGRGIVDDATAVRVLTDDVPALVAEVERLSADNARLRAVRNAAQAGPFPPWISDDVNEFGERECFGCQRHGVEGEHSPRCRFGPIAAALRAAGGG